MGGAQRYIAVFLITWLPASAVAAGAQGPMRAAETLTSRGTGVQDAGVYPQSSEPSPEQPRVAVHRRLADPAARPLPDVRRTGQSPHPASRSGLPSPFLAALADLEAWEVDRTPGHWGRIVYASLHRAVAPRRFKPTVVRTPRPARPASLEPAHAPRAPSAGIRRIPLKTVRPMGRTPEAATARGPPLSM